MRRILAVVLCAFFISGCSVKSNIEPQTKNITFDTRLCYYNECYEASASFEENGEMIFDISFPEEIDGLRLVITADKTTAFYEGMEYKEENPQLFGAFGLVNKIFEDIREKGEKIKRDDESYYVEGRLNGAEYELTVSPLGLPIELEYDYGDLEMSFLNVTEK